MLSAEIQYEKQLKIDEEKFKEKMKQMDKKQELSELFDKFKNVRSEINSIDMISGFSHMYDSIDHELYVPLPSSSFDSRDGYFTFNSEIPHDQKIEYVKNSIFRQNYILNSVNSLIDLLCSPVCQGFEDDILAAARSLPAFPGY